MNCRPYKDYGPLRHGHFRFHQGKVAWLHYIDMWPVILIVNRPLRRPVTTSSDLILCHFCGLCHTCWWRDDVIKCKHFPRYWPFVRGIHWSPVNSLHKGQWHEVYIFLWSAHWINGWANNREAGDLRRHRARYHVICSIQMHKCCKT